MPPSLEEHTFMQEDHPQNQENAAPSQETSAAPPVHTRYDRNSNGTDGCLVFFVTIALLILLSPVFVFGFCVYIMSHDAESQIIGLGIMAVVCIIVVSVFNFLR